MKNRIGTKRKEDGMGDRANVFVKDDLESGRGVFLYTHWGGEELPHVVQAALKRSVDRWNDPSYLTRVIFCEMVKDEDLTSTTGYGISINIGDNEHAIIEIDCSEQTVAFEDPKLHWKFDQYVELSKEEIRLAWVKATVKRQ